MDDLELLERVFLRVGSAENDEQLENVIGKFLCPVLLKLSSQEESVRKKVMELLIHFNKRIKSRPNIHLPLKDLLSLYQDPSSSSFLTNFAIIYIKMGFPRLCPSEQTGLIPQMYNGMVGKPQQHQDSLLYMTLPILQHVDLSTDALKNQFEFLKQHLDISKYIKEFFLDMLLLPYGMPHPSSAGPSHTPSTPPGMSEVGFKRAMGEIQLKPEQLEEIKLGIVKFISSGVLGETDTVPHLVIAAADTRFSIANAADSSLKRIGGTVDWNDSCIISTLYQLFLGTGTSKENIKSDFRRAPACTRLRLKIFPYLIRSRDASSQFPFCLQVTFQGLFGENSNPKLKIMALQFLHQMIYNSPEVRLTPVSPVLISGLMKVINDTEGDSKLRGSALVAVGKLGKKLPGTVTKDMAIVQMLFNAMTQEEAETRMAVQEALSTMAPAFRQLSSENSAILEALLATALESEEYHLRLIAVQYAGVIFPSTHVTSRYLLLLATGDPKEEVSTEAKKFLFAHLPKNIDNDTESMDIDYEHLLPDFVDMVSHIYEKAKSRMKSGHHVTYGIRTLPFNVVTYSNMLSYCRLCLAANSSLVPSLDLLQQPEMIGSSARHYVEKLLYNNGPLASYLDLIMQLLAAHSSDAPLYCLLEIVAGVPQLSRLLLPQLDTFKLLLNNSKEDVRQLTAQLLSVILCETFNEQQLDGFLNDLCKNLKDKPLEQQHGAIVTLGFSIGRRVRILSSLQQQQLKSKSEIEKVVVETLSSNLSPLVSLVIDFLFDTHPLIVTAACVAVGEMGRCGPLLYSDSRKIAEKLATIVNDNKANGKVREQATLAAGLLSVGEVDYPERRFIIEKFLRAAQEVKEVEIHFTIGDALVAATLGSNSPESRDAWVVKEMDFQEPENSPTELEFVLEELLNKYVNHTHPNIKQATSIWLLALVKHCSKRPELKLRLLRVQRAFMTLLAGGGDLVQDIASKGLGLVFECCNSEQQNHLVAELVGTLNTGKRPVTQVTEDTKIFEEGALGAAPSGGQLSTYRELCSLVTDLNQPDLIYKFMHLANHNAIWNSKKGAAFGFGTIAKKAGQQLTSYLPEIVPKLYRYQYDPNPRIQQSMASIWGALVNEQSKTIDLYFHPILDDLINNLTSSLWRNRESSCLAIADLLRGRTLETALDKAVTLWTTLFRVVDDIKESVRKAAQNALRALSKVSIKMVDVDVGKTNSKNTIQVLLPALLENGLTSNVEEVQAISLETLTKIVKAAGNLVSPHLAPLISALLEATQTVEGQSLNYLSVRLGNQHATQEKFDMARIAAAKSSVMYETAQHCIQYTNNENAAAVVSSLIELIKGTHGLTAKGGAAHIICLLTQQCQNEVQPYAGKLMAVLVKGLSDRNVALKKTYALALGHLVRVAKETSVTKLLETLQEKYIEAEEEEWRVACAHTLQAMTRHNPDVVKNHACWTAPIIFLGKHTIKTIETEPLIQIWEELWIETVPGTEVGLRLFSNEIVIYLQRAITSSLWKLKSQSACAIGSMAQMLKGNMEPLSREILIKTLLDGLTGRTWEGKEHLLQALAVLCTTQTMDDPEVRDKILAAVLRESKKESLPYRRYAIETLGKVLESFKIDAFKTVFEICEPMFVKKEENMDEDSEEDSEKQPLKLELQEVAILTLGRAFPLEEDDQKTFWNSYVELLRNTLSATTRPIQLAIVTSLLNVTSKISLDLIDQYLADWNKILAPSLDIVNYCSLRIETLKVLILLLKRITTSNKVEKIHVIREVYLLRVEEALRDPSPEVKTKADEAKKLIMDSCNK